MTTEVKTITINQIITSAITGETNGKLLPIYNVHANPMECGQQPQQAYITTIEAGCIKGPHLHYIRTGYFTCIKGDARIVVKTQSGYKSFFSGEHYGYLSVIVPPGIPAALQNVGEIEALILNLPSPAWTPEMNDEHTADFSDFDFSLTAS